MRQTIEKVALDADYTVTMVTTHLLEGVKLITCDDEREATLMINDNDIAVAYSLELETIIRNLSDHTAEQLLTALAHVDRLAS